MKELIIRGLEQSDYDNLKNIYYGAGSAPDQMPEMVTEAMQQVFLDYYVKEEAGHCFVVDDDGTAVGYILCAPSEEKWKVFFEEHAGQPEFAVINMIYQGYKEPLVRYREQYPAHLHIDLLPEYQRMRLGTRLVDALKAHLKELGISGLMLCVANDNEKGINFYRKYGFTELEKFEHETAMGIRF